MPDVAVVTASSLDDSYGSNPYTVSFDCSGGTLLLACLSFRRNNSQEASATYAGTPLTSLDYQDGSYHRVQLFYLKNPSSGSNTFSITFTISTVYMVVTLVSINYADGTNTFGTVVKNTLGSAKSHSDTVTSETGGLCIDVVDYKYGDGDSLVADSGQTERQTIQSRGTGEVTHGCSTEPGATSVTMGWSQPTTNSDIAYIIAPIRPTSGGTTPTLTFVKKRIR